MYHYYFLHTTVAIIMFAGTVLAQGEEKPLGKPEGLTAPPIDVRPSDIIEGMNRDNYDLQRSNIDRERLDGSSIEYDRLQRSNVRNFRSPFGRVD